MSDDPRPRHKHTKKCFTKVLICKFPRHRHGQSCYETRNVCGYRGLY